MSEPVLLEYYDNLFEQFWLAGMRKMKKKKARIVFTSIAKKQKKPEEWTQLVIHDIKNRLRLNQYGFAAQHPTSYLNGECWEDELPPAENQQLGFDGNAMNPILTRGDMKPRSTRDISLEEQLTDQSWADE